MNINKSSDFTSESLEVEGYRGSPGSGKIRFLVNSDVFDAKERFKGQPEAPFLAHAPGKGRNAELEVIKGNYSVGLYYPNGTQILGPTDAPIFFNLSLSEGEIVKDKIAAYEKNQKLFRDLWDRADSSLDKGAMAETYAEAAPSMSEFAREETSVPFDYSAAGVDTGEAGLSDSNVSTEKDPFMSAVYSSPISEGAGIVYGSANRMDRSTGTAVSGSAGRDGEGGVSFATGDKGTRNNPAGKRPELTREALTILPGASDTGSSIKRVYFDVSKDKFDERGRFPTARLDNNNYNGTVEAVYDTKRDRISAFYYTSGKNGPDPADSTQPCRALSMSLSEEEKGIIKSAYNEYALSDERFAEMGEASPGTHSITESMVSGPTITGNRGAAVPPGVSVKASKRPHRKGPSDPER